MGECLVGLSHLVHILFSLECTTFVIVGGNDLCTKFSAIEWPERLRAKLIIFFIDSETFLSGRNSVGTWKFAPPTRRDFTSI